jgi:hypothetical protein
VSNPRVTIVIVAHSERGELERCLGSIRDQAGMPVQVVLIDNASTDDTVPWARKNLPEVEIIELDENLGVAARQYGLERARAPLTMFLDSDAALTAGALPAMVAALDQHPDWGLIGPRLVGDDDRLQLHRRFPPLACRSPPPPLALARGLRLVRRHLMAGVDHDLCSRSSTCSAPVRSSRQLARAAALRRLIFRGRRRRLVLSDSRRRRSGRLLPRATVVTPTAAGPRLASLARAPQLRVPLPVALPEAQAGAAGLRRPGPPPGSMSGRPRSRWWWSHTAARGGAEIRESLQQHARIAYDDRRRRRLATASRGVGRGSPPNWW